MTGAALMLANDVNVAQQVAFWILASIIVVAAVKVVTTAHVVRAALYLVAVLASVGALYMLAAAEFVATTQFMVYIGAIVVLLLFGLMLTRAPRGKLAEVADEKRGFGAVVAVLLLVVMGYALVDGFSDDYMGPEGELVLQDGIGAELDEIDNDERRVERRAELAGFPATNTQAVSDSIFSDYIVPFEAVSVLLLAALIGAIVLARKE